MSIDYRIYVGPYVRCTVDPVPVTKLRVSCNTPGCKNNGKPMREPYCALCGKHVATQSYVELGQAIDEWDISEAINETLHSAHGDEYARWSVEHNAHLWMPNRPIDLAAGHLETPTDFALMNIGTNTVADEIMRFANTFPGEIAYLQEQYGMANVQILWGVIQDYL